MTEMGAAAPALFRYIMLALEYLQTVVILAETDTSINMPNKNVITGEITLTAAKNTTIKLKVKLTKLNFVRFSQGGIVQIKLARLPCVPLIVVMVSLLATNSVMMGLMPMGMDAVLNARYKMAGRTVPHKKDVSQYVEMACELDSNCNSAAVMMLTKTKAMAAARLAILRDYLHA